MALLFCDGFDHYATADITKKWTAITGTPLISASGGRRSGGALEIANDEGVFKSITAVPTAIVGFAFNPTVAIFATAGSNGDIASFLDNGITHITIVPISDGSLKVYRGDVTTLLGSTAVGLVSVGGYHYIEVKATIDNTAGAVEIQVDGVPVLSLTGIDTQNAGNAVISSIRFGGSTGTNNIAYYDDIYVCDTSGTVNNDFLGDVRIDTLLPNGDGTYSDFTPNSGTDHYSRVAEGAPDTTTYVTSATLDQKDTYTFQDLTAVTGNILGIQVSNAALKDDAGSRSIANVVRSGTTDAVGATVALSTSQLIYSSIHELDPATSAAWTEAGVNAMQAGVKVAV